MFAPWRSQKSLRKHKDPITVNSFIGIINMADRKRYDPVYFHGRRLCNFSKVKPKDKSKVRKQVKKRLEASSLDETVVMECSRLSKSTSN